MKIPRVLVILVCTSLSFAFVSSSVDAASSLPFKDCTQLLDKYYWGVAFNRIAAADLANIIDIRPKIYMANKRLDTDKDGVACEDDSLQNQLAATKTSTIPYPPSYLTPSMTTPFNGTGTLFWSDNSNNEDNFYISNIDPTKLIGIPLSSIWYKAPKNQTSLLLTGLLNGNTYCFWGMASNSIGNSTWSGPSCTLAGTTVAPTTTAYVPPTLATTSTVSIPTRIPPSGNWDGDMLNSSEILLYGNSYQHVLCTSGSPKTTLKLWENVNGSYVQKAESFPVVGDPWCPDPAYPVKHRFFWTVDWLGTQTSGNRYSLTLKVTGMTSDSYVTRTVFTSAGLTQDANEIARKIACIFGKISGC